MIRTIFCVFLFVAGCRNSATSGQGLDGARGETGPAGPQGATGAPGVCDQSSCPSIGSVDGLTGGTVSGTLTTETVSVSQELSAHRIVIKRGTRSTSMNGFYCGTTSFLVDGDGYKGSGSGGPDYEGPWAKKIYCEQTCGNSSAHVCSSAELMLAQDLRGGGDGALTQTPRNQDVPMPPSPNPLDPPTDAMKRGWIRPSDGFSECSQLENDAYTTTGIAFRPTSDFGAFEKLPCTEMHPIYCCL